MTPWEPELAGDRPPLKPGHVWLASRRRDACYALGAVGIIICIELERRFSAEVLWAGVFVLGIMMFSWLSTRWQWSREGTAVPAISNSHSVGPLSIWSVSWVFVGVFGLALLEIGMFSLMAKGARWTARSGLLLAGFAVAWFAGLLLGVAWIKCRFKKPRPADPAGLD